MQRMIVQFSNKKPSSTNNNKEDTIYAENEAFIQLQQDYLITLSNLALAEKDYNRQKTLNSENWKKYLHFIKLKESF